MCYEFWREQQRRAEDETARKRVQEIIEKVKSEPLPQTPRPAPKTRKETVPA